ncbi:MBL fold metallo-hydrolase [Bacillus velezensis]|uniref:MBL fold metallo-hydrolase n=1 Tax=Bacillus velezensis TaxID=492670 RepID=UPI001962D33A|nr:MBL fold metallo-hydrolase [Bacillus velezensis]MBM7029940.1 MBL fold metallo-hydrolase [Bacillus velezensis]MDH3073748.1 MBL fold metallo-hydrolase [Bacillus velezensis]MDH3105349.1 MBL fold metallo-hydrolase [Bacillus velezensis]MDH3137397.1 MBL fold metallo-hydrolase [Bacillus velezensis]
MIKVRMYPAKNGDCFLISLGEQNKKHILIDCGYTETYERFLKPDLIKINEAGEKLNLMIITHIDADHILGAIRFIEDNNKNQFISIDEVWHNSYKHLQENEKGDFKLSKQEEDILKGQISLGKSYIERDSQEGIDHTEISMKQGSTLGALLLKGNYSWNSSFMGKAVALENKEKVEIENVAIRILSPNKSKLSKLERKWIKELRDKKWNFKINENELFDDAYEFMMLMDEEVIIDHSAVSRKGEERDKIIIEEAVKARTPIDTSEINGSSIGILLQFNEKKMLFLGDAHPDIICEGLKNLKEFDFDLVKVPHHGSKKNMTTELANLLKSKIFLVSTNGVKHQHPDIESIAKIISLNPLEQKRLYFNYEADLLRQIDRDQILQKYNCELIMGSGEVPVDVKL